MLYESMFHALSENAKCARIGVSRFLLYSKTYEYICGRQ